MSVLPICFRRAGPISGALSFQRSRSHISECYGEMTCGGLLPENGSLKCPEESTRCDDCLGAPQRQDEDVPRYFSSRPGAAEANGRSLGRFGCLVVRLDPHQREAAQLRKTHSRAPSSKTPQGSRKQLNVGAFRGMQSQTHRNTCNEHV